LFTAAVWAIFVSLRPAVLATCVRASDFILKFQIFFNNNALGKCWSEKKRPGGQQSSFRLAEAQPMGNYLISNHYY
jgi:hypothetical protein